MRLLKPSWVHHDDKPIFSIDVDTECAKFATGGQGIDSGRIVIWNLLPVLCEKAEQDENVPKILCQMDNHLACVNCVRWSHQGQLLASGSDDKLVMVWRKAMGTSGIFGTGGLQNNIENWKCLSTLRGHCGDVLDLAWSPQDHFLASCSIDNTIIVWNVQALPNVVTVLRGHTGLVKGVTWDPAGKFLASQSDDRSVKIWNTSDWTCSTTVTEPFEECGGTTHVLRLSWSPDGQYLVSAHAMNGGGPTAQIIDRENWKCDKDFVGHRKAVTCVRFHNSILRRLATKTSKAQQYCCLAVGSRDRSLSVWMTALQRPLVVIHELFNDSVLDLSWGANKCILLACSGDGSVACLEFQEDELGIRMSESDTHAMYQRLYGINIKQMANCAAKLHNEHAQNVLLSQQQKQITMPLQEPNNNINTSFGSSILPMNGYAMPDDATSNVNANALNRSSTAVKCAIGMQTETRTADGRRRITPRFIPLNQDISESMPPQLRSTSRAISMDAGAIQTPAIAVSNTKEPDQLRMDQSSITRIRAIQGNDEAGKAFSQSSWQRHHGVIFGKEHQRFHKPSADSFKNELIKITQGFQIKAQNGHLKTTNGPLAKISAYAIKDMNAPLWEIFVGSPIVLLDVCATHVLLCCLDASICVLDVATGIAALPVITLQSNVIKCAFCAKGKLLGVITACGSLRIWNIALQCIHLAITCNELLGKYGDIEQFNIMEDGSPSLLFTEGNSYVYSSKMQAWLVLNGRDPITRYGLLTTMPQDLPQNLQTYPLISMQAAPIKINQNGISSPSPSNDAIWQQSAKLSFLQNQIKLCEVMNTKMELKHWHAMLALQLTQAGSEARMRLYLNDLLTAQQQKQLTPAECEAKRELLDHVLSMLKTHEKWQKMHAEYAAALVQLRIENNIKKCVEEMCIDDVMVNGVAEAEANADNVNADATLMKTEEEEAQDAVAPAPEQLQEKTRQLLNAEHDKAFASFYQKLQNEAIENRLENSAIEIFEEPQIIASKLVQIENVEMTTTTTRNADTKACKEVTAAETTTIDIVNEIATAEVELELEAVPIIKNAAEMREAIT